MNSNFLTGLPSELPGAVPRVLARSELDAGQLQALREASDWKLLRLTEEGDSAAFEELFARYETRLVAYATRYTGSTDLARDVCQEVFVKLIRRPPRFRMSHNLAPWLFRVTRNLAIDKRRSMKFEISGEETDAPEPLTEGDPRQSLLDKHDAAAVRDLVEALPDDLRDVVNLRIFGGVAFKEIARILDIPMGTALWRMHRALELLRQEWNRSEQEV